MTQGDWVEHKMFIINELSQIKEQLVQLQTKTQNIELEMQALTTRIRIYIALAVIILSPIWAYTITKLLHICFE